MHRKILYLTLLILFSFFPIYFVRGYENINSDTNYKVIIEDDAQLLNDFQINKLTDSLSKLTKYGNIIFKSINKNNTSTENYASNYYHENFGASSGTMFLIDMDNRMIYIFSDGDNYKTITDKKHL